MEGIYLDNNATTKVADRVFVAMTPYLTNSSIRFGLSHYNSDAEIDFVISHLTAIVNHLRTATKSDTKILIPISRERMAR